MSEAIRPDSALSPAFSRGVLDAYQDRCEGVLFFAIGGKDSLVFAETILAGGVPEIAALELEPPDYVKPEDRAEYLRGYAEGAVRIPPVRGSA